MHSDEPSRGRTGAEGRGEGYGHAGRRCFVLSCWKSKSTCPGGARRSQSSPRGACLHPPPATTSLGAGRSHWVDVISTSLLFCLEIGLLHLLYLQTVFLLLRMQRGFVGSRVAWGDGMLQPLAAVAGTILRRAGEVGHASFCWVCLSCFKGWKRMSRKANR